MFRQDEITYIYVSEQLTEEMNQPNAKPSPLVKRTNQCTLDNMVVAPHLVYTSTYWLESGEFFKGLIKTTEKRDALLFTLHGSQNVIDCGESTYIFIRTINADKEHIRYPV